jgi:hypothetical protein
MDDDNGRMTQYEHETKYEMVLTVVVILIQKRKNRCVAFLNHSKLGAVPIRYASINHKFFVSSQAATSLLLTNALYRHACCQPAVSG